LLTSYYLSLIPLTSSPTRNLLSFHDPPTTDLYPLSLHDALPICKQMRSAAAGGSAPGGSAPGGSAARGGSAAPATSATGTDAYVDRKSTRLKLQSHLNLVCRLLLEKKKNIDDKSTRLYEIPTCAS